MFHGVDTDYYTEPFEANDESIILDKYKELLKQHNEAELKRYHPQVYKMVDVKL
jgi:hypothetical protein